MSELKVTTVYLDKETRERIEDLCKKYHLERGRSTVVRRAIHELHKQEFEKIESFRQV
jgi:predicted transcriptional regulator